IGRGVGDRENPIFCWTATADTGVIDNIKTVEIETGEQVILAGDVGGTKCNLALFSEKGGKLTTVFRQRFASKEFAQFDRIVKEFSRQAAPHLSADGVVAAGFGVAGPGGKGGGDATKFSWAV